MGSVGLRHYVAYGVCGAAQKRGHAAVAEGGGDGDGWRVASRGRLFGVRQRCQAWKAEAAKWMEGAE